MKAKDLINSVERIEPTIGGDYVIVTISASTWAMFVTEAFKEQQEMIQYGD